MYSIVEKVLYTRAGFTVVIGDVPSSCFRVLWNAHATEKHTGQSSRRLYGNSDTPIPIVRERDVLPFGDYAFFGGRGSSVRLISIS